MIFVKYNNQASGILRADHIASQLNAQVMLNDLPENMANETVVFVKDAKPELVKLAKDAGCKVVYDCLDTFAYKDRFYKRDWFDLVDTAIVYSKAMGDALSVWFSEYKVIPHQWDYRIQPCKATEFKPAYIGHRFNCPGVILESDIDLVTDPAEMVEWADHYNCHVSFRQQGSQEALFKPATKVSVAAAVGGIIITSPDAAVKELLPLNYPYVCYRLDEFPRILDKAKHDFGGSIWEFARCQMEEVKAKTSLEVIAKQYERLVNGRS